MGHPQLVRASTLAALALLGLSARAWADHPLSVAPRRESHTDVKLPEAAETDAPRLTPLRFSGDIVLRPEDFDKGTIIAPAVSANWRGALGGGAGPRASYSLTFALQTPPAQSDATRLKNRIHSSGGVSTLGASARFGWYGPENRRGLVVGATGGLAWQLARASAEGAMEEPEAERFVFAQAGLIAGAWVGPVYLGAEYLLYEVLGDEAGEVAVAIDGSRSLGAMVVVAVQESLFVQVKHLPLSDELDSAEAFEIRVVASFQPF